MNSRMVWGGLVVVVVVLIGISMLRSGTPSEEGTASVVTTLSGLKFEILSAGTGETAAAGDTVLVHYTGTLEDGTVFDSSISRGEPAEFTLNGVVPCWNEALQKMKKGEKSQIVCPSAVAYGDSGSPPTIPPGATLSFEVELLDFRKP